MDCSIDHSVSVYVQLKRMSDAVMSEPREFTYLPEQTGQFIIHYTIVYDE